MASKYSQDDEILLKDIEERLRAHIDYVGYSSNLKGLTLPTQEDAWRVCFGYSREDGRPLITIDQLTRRLISPQELARQTLARTLHMAYVEQNNKGGGNEVAISIEQSDAVSRALTAYDQVWKEAIENTARPKSSKDTLWAHLLEET